MKISRAALLALLLAIAGCDGTTEPVDEIGTRITAEGGIVTSSDGRVTLEFPPGAVADPTTVTIEPAAGLTDDASVVPGSGNAFGPDGIAFNAPVRLTIRYDSVPSSRSAEAAFVAVHRREGSGWMPMPGAQLDTIAGTVSADLVGFSDYAAVFSELAIELRALQEAVFVMVQSPLAEHAVEVLRIAAGLLEKTGHPLFQSMVDPVISALKATACSSLSSSVQFAQSAPVDDYDRLSQVLRTVLVWSAITVTLAADCSGSVDAEALYSQKFTEFAAFYVTRLAGQELETDFDLLLEEVRSVVGLRNEAQLLGLGEVEALLRTEAQGPLLEGLRMAAYSACRNGAVHVYLGRLRSEMLTLDYVPYTESDLLEDLQYCATRVRWQLVESGGVVAQGELGGGAGPGAVAARAQAPGIASGTLQLSQQLFAFRCDDGAFDADAIQVSFNGSLVRSLSAGADGNFFASTVSIPVSELHDAAGVDPAQTGTYPLELARVTAGCRGQYTGTLGEPLPVVVVDLVYPAEAPDPDDGDDGIDLSGEWNLVVDEVCTGSMTVTSTSTGFNVSGSVGGAFCPFSASGSGSGTLEGRQVTFGIAFGSGGDGSGTGVGNVTFDGTVSDNRMSGEYEGGGRAGEWSATRR